MTSIAYVAKENNRKGHTWAEPRATVRNEKRKLLPESGVRG